MGMPIVAATGEQFLSTVLAHLDAGSGGWVVTVNLDILLHFERDPRARQAYLAADLRVADGMPLVWASRIQGDRIPERIAGSTLSERLLQPCAEHGRPLLLLGGAPGSAERAAERCRTRFPTLDASGNSTLRFSPDPSPTELARAFQWLEGRMGDLSRSSVVLVGLGSPKQELVIQEMRQRMPQTWFVGVGGSFGFLAGDVRRAPPWLQRVGLEWLFRLAQEPRRLGKRYLIEDAPFGCRLFLHAARARRARGSARSDA
jgi:N-acetylglucosaminyldiphosphoundecaprenol N-acetyl-beta-D-mannosaminyltransferase